MRTARAFLVLVLVLATRSGACATDRIDRPELRVLFVGNSLVYVGNLPAVFDALARRNGRPVQSDMLVKGGCDAFRAARRWISRARHAKREI